MARGKDAPARVGGQIDPYVASTTQQSKQLAGNRLVTAMQEAGASQRAGIASETQLESQRMQGQTQIQMQAARSASDDRRAAEAERGRRDDRQFAEASQKATQAFQARQANLSREHQRAMTEADWGRADKIAEEMRAERSADRVAKMKHAKESSNMILSMVTMGMNREERAEKAQTIIQQKTKEFEEAKAIYKKSKKDTVRRALTDKRLDLPIADILKEQLETRKKAGIKRALLKGPMGLVTTGIDLYKSRKEIKSLEGVADPIVADPMGVLQTQLGEYSTNVDVEWLAPSNIHKLEKALQEGTVVSEDIGSTLGVLEGMQEIAADKIAKFKVGSPEYDFWKEYDGSLFEMQESVEGLADNKIDKIKGDDVNTVGSVVEKALGTIHNRSFGGQAEILRRESGLDWPGMLAEMKKSMEPVAIYPLPEGATPAEEKVWETRRREMISVYPELGGVE